MVKRYRNSGEPPRRRFGPTKDPRYWPALPTEPGSRKAKSWINGLDNIWIFAPLTSVLTAAVFWGVWTWAGTDSQPFDGITSFVSSKAGYASTPAGDGPEASNGSFASDSESGSFGFCHEGGGFNCVVDGDTIYYQGVKIRIADIDTPETHEPRCAEEAQRGEAATQRMHQLVNAGPFSLESIDRDEDNYGRKLRIINRGGTSIGGILVDEDLARWYAGGRRPWC